MTGPPPRQVLPPDAASLALVVVATGAFLAARTFVAFPITPVLLGGDQGSFWMYGSRMLVGELPYRDFFQFTPPGADLVYLAVFAMLGSRLWVANSVVVALGVALAGAWFCLARSITSRSSALVATVLFVVLVLGEELSGTHHAWSLLAILCAVCAYREDGRFSARLATAGALLGLSCFFTQSHGVAALLAIAAFTAWRSVRRGASVFVALERLAVLLAGFAVVLLATSLYFIVHVGVPRLWDCMVSYVWGTMGGDSGQWNHALPERLTTASLPSLTPYLIVYALVPVGCLLAVRRLEREGLGSGEVPNRSRAALLLVVGVALQAEVMLNIDWVRLLLMSAPAILLFFWALDGPGPWRRTVRCAALTVALATAALLVRSTHRHRTAIVALPAGRAAIPPENREELEWLARHAATAPGAAFFAANRPSLYLPLALRNPVYLDAVVPGRQTTATLVDRTIRELDASRVAFVLWPRALDEPEASGGSVQVARLRAYLGARYQPVRVFAGGDELWMRVVDRSGG